MRFETDACSEREIGRNAVALQHRVASLTLLEIAVDMSVAKSMMWLSTQSGRRG